MKPLVKSSLKMAIATLISRVLGLIRELLIAATFGAGGGTDAFFLALKIPNIFRELLGENSFASSFVPVFTKSKQKDITEARKLFASALLFLFIISSVLSLCMIIFAPEIIKLFAPKFILNAKKFELTVTFLKILSPFLIFITLAALLMGVLNTLKFFFIPSFSSAFSNIVVISILVVFTYLRGSDSILILGVATTMGALGQLLFQIPFLIKSGFIPLLKGLGTVLKDTVLIIKRLLISLLALAANQINSLVNTIIASGLAEGAVSWLNYSFRLFYFPLGIIGISLSNSNLILFSEQWRKNNKEKALSIFMSSYDLLLIIMSIVAAIFIVLAKEIVSMIYERGAFTSEDTLMTALNFKYYLLGLPAYALYRLLGPTFYAIDRPKIPVISSIISVVFNLAISITLAPIYGQQFLALAITVAMTVNVAILMGMFKKDMRMKISQFFSLKQLKIIFSAVVVGIIILFLKKFFPFSSLFLKFTSICSLGIVGLLLYILLLTILSVKIIEK